MPDLPPEPKQYSVEIVRSDGHRKLVYEAGNSTSRIEESDKTGLTCIVLSRSDKGMIWMLDSKTRTYSHTKLPKDQDRVFDPDMLFDWVADGSEMIDGRRCRRFVGRLRNRDGSLGTISTIVFIDGKTGMRRREVTLGQDGRPYLTIDYLNAVVGKPPRSLFEIPEGYKRAYYRRTRG